MAVTYNSDRISIKREDEGEFLILKCEDELYASIYCADGDSVRDTNLKKLDLESLIPWLIASYQAIGGDKNDLEIF